MPTPGFKHAFDLPWRFPHTSTAQGLDAAVFFIYLVLFHALTAPLLTGKMEVVVGKLQLKWIQALNLYMFFFFYFLSALCVFSAV